MDIKTKINAKILEIEQKYNENLYNPLNNPGIKSVELSDGCSVNPHSPVYFKDDLNELKELAAQL